MSREGVAGMPEPESESESSQVGWCTPVQAVVGRFLAAVEARDPDAVAACCAQDATYRNVPHPPAVGRDAIRALFARILDASSDVRWYLVSAAWSERCGHLERIDRFRIGGIWHEIECHGVWEVDPEAGLVTSVRDYLDLGVWHERLGDALG